MESIINFPHHMQGSHERLIFELKACQQLIHNNYNFHASEDMAL